MIKPKMTILIIAFLFSLSIQIAAQSQQKTMVTGTATVSGQVLLKGEPARGVAVILQSQQHLDPVNSPRAKTDENGRFFITGVVAGRYSINALAPGYVSPGEIDPSRPGQTLNVAEGEKIENIELEIKRGGVISGRITDSQDRPVIEESVNLRRLDKNNNPQNYWFYGPNNEMYRTDDRGVYRIYGLSEGRYLVSVGRAQSPGSVSLTSSRKFYSQTYYPNTTVESEAQVIEVSEGSEATDIDITVSDPKQTYDIYGRVVDAETGQPVPGVEIVVGGLSKDGRPTGAWASNGTRSGQGGEFRLFGVVPGKYALFVRPEDGGGFLGDPVIFDISEGDATGIEVKVRQGASISGVAAIEGTSDPKVLAKLSQINFYVSIRPTGQSPPQPGGRRPIKVNADGSFRIQGLQPGKTMISLIQTSNTRGFILGRIEHNGAPVRNGIEVSAGEHVTGVRVVILHGSLTLRGEVKVVGGALPVGQKFFTTVRRIDQPIQTSVGAEVDTRGQFVIENLPPGEYEVGLSPVFNPNNEPLNPQILRLIRLAKERVLLSSDNQQPVVLVIDLSRKGENQ